MTTPELVRLNELQERLKQLEEYAKGHSDQRVVRRREIIEAISKELNRAYSKHGREQWGRHEFYGILKEEVDELWDAIKADHPQGQVVMEAIQIAALCFRYLETRDRYREPSNAPD